MVGEQRARGDVLPEERGEMDDITLGRARAGDDSALESLVERYHRRVYSLVGRMMVGREQLVDDLAQEVFVKVLAGLPRFDPRGPARLSTWILTVATRTCLDVLRARRPAAEPIPASLVSAADPEAQAADRQMGRQVEAAMASLPEDMRAVVVLRAYHDLDYDEIAAVVGVEVGTVKSRLGRARDQLREALGGMP